MILDKIVEQKKIQLEEEMKQVTLEGLKERIKNAELRPPLNFYNAIKRSGELSIIAEVKKASPSKGLIKENFEPVEIAKEYSAANVQAISVLTEKNFFLGRDDFLVRIKQSVPIPVLRKDFIINLWQVYQARYMGADSILLIAAILNDDELKEFRIVANMLEMQCLVEVHNMEELERVLKTDAKIIGINNRDLKTFEVDLKTTEKLMNNIPHDKAVVSESGIRTNEDMKYLKSLGVDAVLIGETFMRAGSITDKINELRA